MVSTSPLRQVEEAVAALSVLIGSPPTVGVILGSGLGHLADEIAGSVIVPLFSTMASHRLRRPTSRSVASMRISLSLASISTFARMGIVFLRSTIP